jgi:hypothetical protein
MNKKFIFVSFVIAVLSSSLLVGQNPLGSEYTNDAAGNSK